MGNSTRNIVYQVIITIISGLAVVAGIIALNSMIARTRGIDALGEYLLVRSIAFAIIPVTLFGTAVAIPRYMGISRADTKRQKQILAAGVTLFLRYGLAVILVIFVFLGINPTLIGNRASFTGTVLPLVTLCVGLSLHQIAYSYFRGKLTMATANILQLINVAAVPIALVWFIPILSVGKINLWHGLTAGFVVLVVLIKPAIGGWLDTEGEETGKQLRKELSSYGFRRIGANLGMLVLLSLGPVLMARLANYEELAFFSVGIQVNRMFYPLFGPIGIVLLPVFAYYVSDGRSQKLGKSLRALFMAGTAIGIYATIHLWYFAEPLLKLWLGSAPEAGIFIFRLFILSTTAYLWFELARNPIDAYSKVGYNSRNILISVAILIGAVFLGISVLHYPAGVIVTCSYVLAFLVLGGLSVWTCFRLYQIQSIAARFILEIAVLNILVLFCVWMITAPFDKSQLTLFMLAGIEIFGLGVYILGLFFLKQEWLMFLLEHFRRSKVSA